MRLGGPVYQTYTSPAEWVAVVRRLGYRAAYCPVGLGANDAEIQAYAQAARQADIVIAEVGAWSNPLSPDPAARAAAVEKCQSSLALAEKIGARCCVNIAGSRGVKWDGPDPADLTDETFEMIVASVREIIDAVQPRRTFYTLEPMPWMYPDSVESYQELVEAIDRSAFAVHLDEVRPGLGKLDYRTFLGQLARCDPDLPLMLEHLPGAQDYDLAAAYVRQVAQELGVAL